MKFVGAIVVILIIWLQYQTWWGDSGHFAIKALEEKIANQEKQNQLLKKENLRLMKEISALRENADALEEKAREKLGLIKPDETFLRIVPKDDTN
jgi:cell division protein FtsB